MPFRQYNKILSNNLFALQAQQNPKQNIYHHSQSQYDTAGGRVFFFISKNLWSCASITVEAAWLSVLFLTAVLAVLSLFELFYAENRLQAVMENLGTKAAMSRLVEERAGGSLDFEGEVYSLLGNMLFSGAQKAYLEEELSREMNSVLPGNFCKIGGLRLHSRYLYQEKEIADLVVSYEIRFPIIGAKVRMLRCRKRLWSGNQPASKQEGKTVYMTVTGSVYHLYEDCSHLKLTVRPVPAENLATLRNEGGGRYTPCQLCVKKGEAAGNVWITSEGSRYHSENMCSGLKRSVLKVDISNVGDRPLCRRCAERENGKDGKSERTGLDNNTAWVGVMVGCKISKNISVASRLTFPVGGDGQYSKRSISGQPFRTASGSFAVNDFPIREGPDRSRRRDYTFSFGYMGTGGNRFCTSLIRSFPGGCMGPFLFCEKEGNHS